MMFGNNELDVIYTLYIFNTSNYSLKLNPLFRNLKAETRLGLLICGVVDSSLKVLATEAM